MLLRYFLLILFSITTAKAFGSDDFLNTLFVEFPERIADIETSLKNINQELDSLYQRLNKLDGEEDINKFISSVKDYENSDIVIMFFKRLAANIRSFRLASATISSGEVSVDQSMLYLSRSVSIGALEFLSTQSDSIPVFKSLVHNSVGVIEKKIRNNQLQDNENLYHGSPDIGMLPYYEAHEIMRYLDYDKIARKRDRLETASKEVAKIWIKSCTKYLKEKTDSQSKEDVAVFVENVMPIFMSKILVQSNRVKKAKLWRSGVLGLLRNKNLPGLYEDESNYDEISL